MDGKQEILNRVTLLMNYDSSKTLNENKRCIVNEQYAAVERALKTFTAAEKTALIGVVERLAKRSELFTKDGKKFLYNRDNPLPQIEAAIKNGTLYEGSMGRIRTGLIKKSVLSNANRAILIDDLTSFPGFMKDYKGFTGEEVKASLRKAGYTPRQAEEITNTYIKKRNYDVPPTTIQGLTQAENKIKAETAARAEREAVAKAEREAADAVAGKKGETIGKTEAEIAAAKEAERIASLGKEGEVVAKNEIRYRNADGEEVIIRRNEKIAQGEELLGKSSPTAGAAAEKEIIEKTVKETRPEILNKFPKIYKIYRIAKGTLTFALIAGAAGLIWLVISKIYGPDAIPVNENGDVIGEGSEDPSGYDSTWANPGGYAGSNDMSAANAAADEAAAAEAERQRLTSQQQAPSSLSMSNIANSFGKTIPAAQALSPEEKDHLINNIRNGKRYVGADLNPAQRAFVDQYMKNIESRLPSKEKTKYIKNEPVRQNIKYGKKI